MSYLIFGYIIGRYPGYLVDTFVREDTFADDHVVEGTEITGPPSTSPFHSFRPEHGVCEKVRKGIGEAASFRVWLHRVIDVGDWPI